MEQREPRKDEHGNYRIFEHEASVRFNYAKYKVIKSNTKPPILEVGFEFRGERPILIPHLYCIPGDNKLDGYTFDCVCEKIAEPDDFMEYLKTIENPETLRADYKKRYYELMSSEGAKTNL